MQHETWIWGWWPREKKTEKIIELNAASYREVASALEMLCVDDFNLGDKAIITFPNGEKLTYVYGEDQDSLCNRWFDYIIKPDI